MRYVCILVLCVLAAPLRAATGCEDVWFTRNLIMDRAGYCFSSPLGRALFDNSDCIGTSVQPDAKSMSIVAQIRSLEAQHNCRVDTNRTWIDLPDINFRRVLTDHPIRDEFESSCLGWIGATANLYAGQDGAARILGQIFQGDYVHFAHYGGAPGWSYVTVGPPSGPMRTAGWLYWPNEHPCADFAG